VTDNASSGRGASFGYTDAGRLATAAGAWGGDTYTYDAAGNRLDKARDIGGTVTHETAVLSSTSNRVDTVSDGASTTLRTLTYRTGGDLSQAAFTGGPTYVYQYNARKRLSVVKKDGVDAAWYGYDYAGHRVWRSVFGATTVQTHYIFDADGHLIAEHDGATGAVLREYVWLDDTPVAMIDSSSGTAQTYFIHAGQLDEPLVMTDTAKAKVWDAYVEPYGKAQVFGTPSAGLDLRLPGQWEEAETGGLHQNWFRNYDPSLGRYIEADPLGIEAGQNVYAYVEGMPTAWSDASGLDLVLFEQPKNPALYARAIRQSESGRFTVKAHGNQYGAYKGNQVIDPKILAEMIQKDKTYKKGQTVILASCHTAGYYAQFLADYLQAPVWAPSNYVFFRPDGKPYTANGRQAADGTILPGTPTKSWILFRPTK
jgi:RHS repeat-associated protein